MQPRESHRQDDVRYFDKHHLVGASTLFAGVGLARTARRRRGRVVRLAPPPVARRRSGRYRRKLGSLFVDIVLEVDRYPIWTDILSAIVGFSRAIRGNLVKNYHCLLGMVIPKYDVALLARLRHVTCLFENTKPGTPAFPPRHWCKLGGLCHRATRRSDG